MILASPTKSKIRTLQSIGRVLRKGLGKVRATLYDIGDDLVWKRKPNFAMKHFKSRIEIYAKEGFKYKIFNIKL